ILILFAVLQFPGPVSDLVESHDKQVLFAACMSGVYCVIQSSLADASSSPSELKISSEFLLVPEEGVLSLLLVGSVLLTLSQRDTSWILTLYNCPKQSASSSCESLTSFSLPLVSSVVQDDDEGKTGVRRRPVLICVCSGDATPLPSSSTSSSEVTLTDRHIRLEPVLFKLLFGVDAALAKSPVILCGLPDGCLCFLPVRLAGSRPRVLHNLEQPVVFVGASAVMKMGLGHAQCLVAVGELGRVVLIKTDKGGPEGGGNTAGFTERCVPGPVVCGCVDKNCLYYSTGSDLLRLDLNEETSSKTDAARQSPTSLSVCRVVALAEPAHNPAGEVELLGLSVRGQIQRITLPLEKEDTGLSKMPSTQVGRSVRDLLSAIGDVCDRASMLKTGIKSKNQILKHLNQVLNISFLLVAGTNSEENLIRCHATTKWSRLLQKDSLNLTCVLDNSSPYVLEHGWTLSVTVFPLSYPPSAGGESPSTNFSFPFHSLPAGESLEVSLPLAAAGVASFPMTVSCSLIFSLSSLLGEEAANFKGLQCSCISLPLNTLTVDWLHALQVSSPIDAQKMATSQCNNTATDTIQTFLNSRRIKCSGRGEGGGENASKPKREQFSASVRVLSELVRDMLVVKSSDEDPQGPKLALQNVHVSLLEWLLSEGFGGVRTGHQGDKMSRSVIHARGPNGHTVKLTAKESVGKEESLTTVEVQVESSSIAAVCGLHHAMLRRVQRAASTKSIRSLGLRRALQRAEVTTKHLFLFSFIYLPAVSSK
uniref:FA core complex associated protein 100 n=1 Tax=Sparus aurata TaxID=8175 RepID=A0A671TV02_SPAAU